MMICSAIVMCFERIQWAEKPKLVEVGAIIRGRGPNLFFNKIQSHLNILCWTWLDMGSISYLAIWAGFNFQKVRRDCQGAQEMHLWQREWELGERHERGGCYGQPHTHWGSSYRGCGSASPLGPGLSGQQRPPAACGLDSGTGNVEHKELVMLFISGNNYYYTLEGSSE